MELNKLPKTKIRKKKRRGRGYGSGKGGHTTGRGAKGLKARSKLPLTFAGSKIKKTYLKRLPLWRGRGKFKSLKLGPVIVNLKYLSLLPSQSKVDVETLVKHQIIDSQAAYARGVKILGAGEVKQKLTVNLPCSQAAIKKIEKAGGRVIFQPKRRAIKKDTAKKPSAGKTKKLSSKNKKNVLKRTVKSNKKRQE